MLRQVAGGSPRKFIPSDGASGYDSPASEKKVAEEEEEELETWQLGLTWNFLFEVYIHIIIMYT